MNGVLLALACFGALAAIVAAGPDAAPPPLATAEAAMTAHPGAGPRDPGSMTIARNVDAETGEVTEISVIAFRD